MNGDVIQFRPRPPEPADGYDGLRCPDCGCPWFELGSRVDDAFELVPGQVCIDSEGSITGYSGTPHCAECLREVLP